jgi:hypothetical protein
MRRRSRRGVDAFGDEHGEVTAQPARVRTILVRQAYWDWARRGGFAWSWAVEVRLTSSCSSHPQGPRLFAITGVQQVVAEGGQWSQAGWCVGEPRRSDCSRRRWPARPRRSTFAAGKWRDMVIASSARNPEQKFAHRPIRAGQLVGVWSQWFGWWSAGHPARERSGNLVCNNGQLKWARGTEPLADLISVPPE